MSDSSPVIQPSRPGAITIARHGRPDADRNVRLDWRGYEDWWDNTYQPAGLSPGQFPPPKLKAAAEAAHTVYCSTLQRAIETAQAAAPGRELVIRDDLIEAELPPPPMPGRFKAKTWGVFARTSWWLGQSRGRESRAEAEDRARRCANMLHDAALRGDVVVCAHGWFNRMMRPHLKALGWRVKHDGGDSYWSFRRYEFKG